MLDEKNIHNNLMGDKNYPEPDIPVDKAWSEMKAILNNKTATTKPTKGVAVKYVIVSTVSCILVVTAYYFFQQKSIDLKTTIVHRSKNYTLQDTLLNDAVIHLNANSTVHEVDDRENNTLVLTRGGVYIKGDQTIKQNTILTIGSLKIYNNKATLYAYIDTAVNICSILVQNGVAIVEDINGKKQFANAGETILYNEANKQFNKKQKIDLNTISYATHIFEFSNTPLKEVAAILEKAYNITIVFANDKLFTCSITTRFDNKSLYEILDVIAYTINIEYQTNKTTNQVILIGEGCE
ncbi:MAG: DUF4974 domain-containing protein [Chitinophagaceae bacterium]